MTQQDNHPDNPRQESDLITSSDSDNMVNGIPLVTRAQADGSPCIEPLLLGDRGAQLCGSRPILSLIDSGQIARPEISVLVQSLNNAPQDLSAAKSIPQE